MRFAIAEIDEFGMQMTGYSIDLDMEQYAKTTKKRKTEQLTDIVYSWRKAPKSKERR